MFIEFKDLPDSSRVWIYQSKRTFSDQELNKINEKLYAFTNDWRAHGQKLKASYLIKYDQFIIIAVDEKFNDASGCSIDASVHTIQELQNELDIDLMNKMNVSFRDGKQINTISMLEFKEFAKQNKIKVNTLVFNNMVTSKADFESNWEVEAGQSWHSRFLK